jgi:nitroreductase
MSFDSILKKRHCSRKFSTKKVSLTEVLKVAEAARFSPMAGNIFTIKLVIVGNQEKKNEIAEAALQQYFLSDSSYILVVCSDITNLGRSYEHQAEKYARQQAGAAIENMFLKATDLNLACCWVGAFDEEKIKTILKIPNHIHVEALLPVGNQVKQKTKEKLKPKKKPDLKIITHFEKWGQREFKPAKKPPAY